MSVVQAGIAVLNSMPEGTFIVSLGGGSSMDAAKAISVIGPDGGVTGEDIAQYCMVPELAEGSETINMATLLPNRMASAASTKIIAMPTTSGTASETNGAAVISDDRTEVHRKLIFSYPGAAAVQTILDPELTLGLPPYPTATCGMDALTHSIEALTSAKQNPYSDAVALGAIKLVAEWLPTLMEDLSNLDARLHIMTASHMAGIAFGIAGLGICHAVGHPLSALLNKAHGQTLSTMLPHVRTHSTHTAICRSFT
jgi:alcohol dehydrogenase